MELIVGAEWMAARLVRLLLLLVAVRSGDYPCEEVARRLRAVDRRGMGGQPAAVGPHLLAAGRVTRADPDLPSQFAWRTVGDVRLAVAGGGAVASQRWSAGARDRVIGFTR